MNILLNPMGSGGDVLPFIRLGMALQARGHDVTVITMGRYEPLARHAGLDFVEWISPEAMQAIEDNPDLWHSDAPPALPGPHRGRPGGAPADLARGGPGVPGGRGADQRCVRRRETMKEASVGRITWDQG
jgi:hypothetical protein